MSSRKPLNNRTPDQRSPAAGRQLNSGRADHTQLETQSAPHERGDERRATGGPGKADKSNQPSLRKRRREHDAQH